MPSTTRLLSVEPANLKSELELYLQRCLALQGGDTTSVKPSHRVKFEWPPTPISYSFHVVASDWTGRTTIEAQGEKFEVKVARTPFGVFGRCEETWHEARGGTEEEMLGALRAAAEPLFRRQQMIAATMERKGRFSGNIRELPALDLLKLLYCPDRDVANDAHLVIETDHDRFKYLPALLTILNDRTHAHRRSAQWCVLDLFEDLPSFCTSPEDELSAVASMQGILWDATEDYARTVYKAGVVLGGHLPHRHGGRALIECLDAPSKFGRRSAIHGLFHVVEWVPETKKDVIHNLRVHEVRESDPLLQEFTRAMIEDIQRGGIEHTPEPVFPEEY